MNDYLYLLAGLLVGLHTYSYGRYVHRQGNKAGALVAYLLVLTVLALPAYRLLKNVM